MAASGLGRGKRDAPAQRGFTLVEVLVAVVVLSIGLLGLASMQALGMQYNQSSYLRTQAIYLSEEMMERMRTNTSEALDGAYDNGFGDSLPSDPGCDTSTCNPGDLADHELREWLCRVGRSGCGSITGLLPGGEAQITRNGNQFTITVRWDDRDANQQALSLNSEIRE